MTTRLKHNHEPLPFGGYVDEGKCVACDARRAEKIANGETPHSHQRRGWARVDGCPRCIELANGAPRRLSAADRQAEFDRLRSLAIKAHTNENCHYMTRTPSGHWTGCCVCFDW